MANPPGPHVHMLAGNTHEVYWRLREQIGSDERGAAMIAGAYSRPLMMQNANFFVQTESELNVVDLQTHSLFVDIRIPTDRLRTGAGSLAEMTPQALQDLARCHCFAGYSVVNYDIAGYEGLPVCNRLHCIDWAPIDGDKNNNQWRVQPVWDKGGWVELGVLKDEFAQAAYVEHWETLPGTREGPFLALRRAAGEPSLPWPTMPTLTVVVLFRGPGQGRDAILVVAGGHLSQTTLLAVSLGCVFEPLALCHRLTLRLHRRSSQPSARHRRAPHHRTARGRRAGRRHGRLSGRGGGAAARGGDAGYGVLGRGGGGWMGDKPIHLPVA